MKIKRKIIAVLLCCMVVLPIKQANAVPIAEIIRQAVIKVIKAVDLQIQRLQNKTIWLQNAQKTIENELSKLKLDQISEWTEKQKTLYRDYYEELQKVKSIIAYYNRVRNITQKQLLIMQEYKRAWSLFQQDKHFTTQELGYMSKVYGGILEQSTQNMEQLYMVINSFKTQMTDAKRLELIQATAERVDENYFDLTRFNQQNAGLSLQRAKGQHEVDMVKKLYGLQ